MKFSNQGHINVVQSALSKTDTMGVPNRVPTVHLREVSGL